MTKVVKQALVSGKVQGVFYRATTRKKALSLGLTGHAKNLSDGRVEVLAFGADEQVDKLLDWLWTGSITSKVTGVEIADPPNVDTSLLQQFVTR